jgi:hypothetical protein
MLIAIGSEVPNTVSIPLSLGALRAQSATSSELSWVEEATIAHVQGRRPVLVGDISQPESLLASLLSAKKDRPQIRFAMLLHFSQALQTSIPDSLRSQFDEVFVAVDQLISAADAHAIRQAVRPRWLLIPRVGLDWNEILIGRLMPDRRGTVTVLCPPPESPWATEGPFLSADELLIQVQAFQHEHPLIEVRPPPHEWFVPSNTSPWDMPSRDLRLANVLKKTEESIVPSVSFIVPLHSKNQSSGQEQLTTCLRACLRVVDYIYAMSETITVEYILSVDKDFDTASFDVETLRTNIDPRFFRSLTIVESARTSAESDWRAGFIRNVGARFSRVGSGGLLVFIDSDVEIVDPAIVASEIIEGRNSLVFSRVRSEIQPIGVTALSQENQPFQVASSRLMIVRRSLFENLGGFANAFRTYGCEDNFLVWQTTEILRKGLPVSIAAFPFVTTRDLSPSIDKEDLFVKMARLTAAADLFYRMTFDPRVHRHFFVSLGNGLGFRYFLKRMACGNRLRLLLGPVVFLLTLIETKNRGAYLRGLWDVITWKVKRPLLKLWGESRRFLSVQIFFPALHFIGQIPWWTKVTGERLWGLAKLAWGGIKFSAGWGHKLFVDYIWIPGLRVAKSPYHLTRLYGWRILAFVSTPFRYSRDNFWKLAIIAKKIRGELWRIPVLWNRLLGRLWFVPVGFKRIAEKIRAAVRFLKEKNRGTS